MAQLTKKQIERYKAQGKIGKSPVSASSGKGTGSPTPPSSPSPAKSIFDTPQARENVALFKKVTGENTTNIGNLATRMFDIVLAKQKIYASGPQATDELDVDTIRMHLFELLGDAGWERTLFFLAQCARLWAELPGPKSFDDTDKALMHTLSTRLTALQMIGRAVDKVSRGPK